MTHILQFILFMVSSIEDISHLILCVPATFLFLDFSLSPRMLCLYVCTYASHLAVWRDLG